MKHGKYYFAKVNKRKEFFFTIFYVMFTSFLVENNTLNISKNHKNITDNYQNFISFN